MLLATPLLVIVVAIYNVLAFGSSDLLFSLVGSIPLLSGQTWTLSVADLLLALGLVLLYLEIFKATRTGVGSIIDHLLSMVLFVVCLIEFLALPGFGNSTFFLIMAMTFIDVVSGFTVTISGARRDIDIEGRSRF